MLGLECGASFFLLSLFCLKSLVPRPQSCGFDPAGGSRYLVANDSEVVFDPPPEAGIAPSYHPNV